MIILIFSIIAGLLVWYAIFNYTTEHRLKNAYKNALQAGDRDGALKAAQEYFGYIRNGELTPIDKQKVAKDIIYFTQLRQKSC